MRITNPLTQTKKKRLPQPPRPLCKTRPCTRFTANTGTSRSCFPPYLSFHRSHPVISRPTSVSSVFTGWAIFTSVLSRSALIFHIVLQLRSVCMFHIVMRETVQSTDVSCVNLILFCTGIYQTKIKDFFIYSHVFICVFYAKDAYNNHRLSSSKNNKSSAKTLEKHFLNILVNANKLIIIHI